MGMLNPILTPRCEVSPQAVLRCTAVTAEAKGTLNLMLLMISLYPVGRCSAHRLQLTLINRALMESQERKLTKGQSWSVQSCTGALSSAGQGICSPLLHPWGRKA